MYIHTYTYAYDNSMPNPGWARAFEFKKCFWSFDKYDPHYYSQENVYNEIGPKILRLFSLISILPCIAALRCTFRSKFALL